MRMTPVTSRRSRSRRRPLTRRGAPLMVPAHGRSYTVPTTGETTVRTRTKAVLGVAVLAGLALLARGEVLAGDKPKVGDKAPAFQSTDENGQAWKSADHVGKKIVVLYFYPADFTGGCTAQACGFRDNIEALGKNVEVIGVSGDSAKNHAMFKKHHKLPFTLL